MNLEVERMLRLAEQCLERAKSFIEKTTDPHVPYASPSAASACSLGQSETTQPVLPPTTTAGNIGQSSASNQEGLFNPHKAQSLPTWSHKSKQASPEPHESVL